MLTVTDFPNSASEENFIVANARKEREVTESLSMPALEMPAGHEETEHAERGQRNGRQRMRLSREASEPDDSPIPIPTVLNILGPSLVVRDLAVRLRNAAGKFMDSALAEPSGMGFTSKGGDIVDAKPLMAELNDARRKIGRLFEKGDQSPGSINARMFASNLEKHIDMFRIALVRGRASAGLGQDAVDGALVSAAEFKSEITGVMLNIDAAVANAGVQFAAGGADSDHDAA